jgi:Tfp pilus assembly protein PilZ
MMNEAKIRAEKRQSPRVKPSFSVRYKALQDGAETVDAGSVDCDISTGGLRFMANEFFSTACRLILELDIPAAPEPIKAVSEVAWIQKANPGAGYQYEVGNQFMEITEKDRERIAMYVSSHYH